MKLFNNDKIRDNGDYLNLLSAVSKISGLFSESSIPYINYRVAENIFCKCFEADNLSRSDTAYDAKINNIGIGIKTFTCLKDNSLEKIAEFNSLSKGFVGLSKEELAHQLSSFRNDRINLANRIYNIDQSYYHIIARRNKELVIFDTDYDIIDLNTIHSIEETKSGIKFRDRVNEYGFNRSKSTLYRKFHIEEGACYKDIEILKDPFELLLSLFNNKAELISQEKLIPGKDFIILPLYGYKDGEKFIYERSGLNQWNAEGRERNQNEVYIPVSMNIHKSFLNFFPPIKKDDKQYFQLHLPNQETYDASMCQGAYLQIEGEQVNKGKGLMTKSNKGLGYWLLRKALQLKENQLATYKMLEDIGYDSVIIYKIKEGEYKIDIMKLDSFEDFKADYMMS